MCHHCQQELGTKNFFERDGVPYCETDYHNIFSPKCAYCNAAILGVSFIVIHLLFCSKLCDIALALTNEMYIFFVLLTLFVNIFRF